MGTQLMTNNNRAIPCYKSLKEVQALEIGKIEGCTLHFVDTRFKPIEVSEEYIEKYPLNLPGYYVVRDGKEESFMEKDEFEAFHNPIL